MIDIKIIHYQTGESQEKILTAETMIQGGGLIGRHPGCDLVLNSPEVSRVHGRIFYKAGEYYFTDLGSTDGSLVNSKEIKTNQNCLLKKGDIIRIGEFILLIQKVDSNGNRSVYQHQNNSVANAYPAQTQQLIFKAEELILKGILKEGSSELVFQGKVLVKGLSISKRFYQKALELCQAEIDAGKFCLLVEHADHFTHWISP